MEQEHLNQINLSLEINQQDCKLNKKKRRKDEIILISTNTSSFSKDSLEYDLEKTSQQVKRLKLSFNASPVLVNSSTTFKKSFSQSIETSSFKMKSLTNKLIELTDDGLNSNSVDSGFSQISQNMSQDEEMVMFDLNESMVSEFAGDENETSFRINKSKGLKLLDISNCSNNSINSPFQAKRCLFKSNCSGATNLDRSALFKHSGYSASPNNSPFDSNNITSKSKLQITPISISRHNSIITNDLSEQSENQLILSELFNKEAEKDEKQKQKEHENIMKMLDLEHKAFSNHKSVQNVENDRRLIGDHSSYHILPCTTSIKHNDLNVITPATLTRVLNGEFDSIIDKLIIIDSRYPYEYEGGHICNAKNVYTKENIIEMFLNKDTKNSLLQYVTQNKENDNRRVLVIFHCEFSSERGPGLLRFLRNQDRLLNKDSYPKLFYPELYLLEGGYKQFYEQHRDFCEPKLYKPMLHKDHVEDLKHFRAKTKTWESQNKFWSNHYASTQKAHPTSRLINKDKVLKGIQRFPRSTLF